jgi:hypothetical protein
MYVDKKYFTPSQMGCYSGKYADHGLNSSSYYNLDCDNKNLIAYLWEGQNNI